MRPGPRDAFDPPDPDLAAQCAMCKATYNLDTSDALNPTAYCSRECEVEDQGEPEQDPRERDADDGQQYGDPRDEMDERLRRD